MASLDQIRRQKRALIERHARSDNIQGLIQAANTLIPIGLLWWGVIVSVEISLWLTAVLVVLLVLFTVRDLVLMHDCGHGCMFRSRGLNRAFGFVFGVLAGMPQYVWSRHHAYHHVHNGNWEKYRGPLTTPTTDEFAAMGEAGQRHYQQTRHIAAAPVGGFLYLVFNPRFTLLKGSLQCLAYLIKGRFRQPSVPLREQLAAFETRCWATPTEYWHMLWNNVALVSLWVLMCQVSDVLVFFVVWVLTVSLAGAAGMILFTVQHNFEHAYAADGRHWDYDRGAVEGTSFLQLPRWLNWFTADIGYHHVHHLSAAIPNYCLAACHQEHRQLFNEVPRIRLSGIPAALKCILWDVRAQRIISVAEYRRQSGAPRPG